MSEISKYEKFMKSCEPYQEIINDVTLDECMSVVSGIPISCNHEEIIVRAIGQRLLKLKKIEEELEQAHNNSFIFRDAEYTLQGIEEIVKGN